MPPENQKKSLSPALLALTASALAIPGMPAQAQAPGEDAMPVLPFDSTLLDYRFSAYREGNIPASKTASGLAADRYRVDSNQFRAASQIDSATAVNADITVETMSGASPWFVIPNAAGKPVEVMSGASIHDFRQAIQARGDHRIDNLTGSLLAGFSNERDYRSVNAGFEGSWDFNHKLSNFSAGFGYTHDEVDPTGGRSAAFPNRIAHADNHEFDSFAGVSQVLGRETVIQTSISFDLVAGYQSDPYKLAYVAGNTLNDTRPDSRHRLAWNTRLRQNIRALDAAVHLDYRYYHDDWGIAAHTVSLAWYQTLPDGWAVVPQLRWYSQSQADFYQPYYNSAQSNGLYSSDYRLSPYGAFSGAVGAYKQLGTWNFSLRYEDYRSGRSYAIHHIDVVSPGLVNFQVYSLGIAKTF
jgi:hypothetical protein